MHGVEFDGWRLPLGVGVFYYPTKAKYKHRSKVEARLSYGVFLGYVVDVGNTWTGMYQVMDLDDFVNVSLDQRADYKQHSAAVCPHFAKVVKLDPGGSRFFCGSAAASKI